MSNELMADIRGFKPKKYYGQHFLAHTDLARKIVEAVTFHQKYQTLIEVGPGKGILTRLLLEIPDIDYKMVEVDLDCINYLKSELSVNPEQIIHQDFLKCDLSLVKSDIGIIGNFPYNISSQILFKVLDHRDKVMEVVGMFQKEVAKRISARPSSKEYGILSVLVQAYYQVELLFNIKPGAFIPPPKVDSSVVRFKRNQFQQLDCDERLFFKVVKQGFQKRRKTLRNALKPLNLPDPLGGDPVLDKRAEQLNVDEFIELTNKIEVSWKL